MFVGPRMTGKSQFILNASKLQNFEDFTTINQQIQEFGFKFRLIDSRSAECSLVFLQYQFNSLIDQVVLVFNNNYFDLEELDFFFLLSKKHLQSSKIKNQQIILLCYGANKKVQMEDEINFAANNQLILIRSNYDQEQILQASCQICKICIYQRFKTEENNSMK
ncbi:hypothetical protein ABPG72_012018 [Tetrahymena utriculariae]